VSRGHFAGRDLAWLQGRFGESLLGRVNRQALDRGSFPLLIKLLDAREWLSVQVHPDDDYAATHENDLGKTEMWVVLGADVGAEILLGFESGVDAESFRNTLGNGTVEECLHRTPARPGDVFFVPPGTIHAIGPGVLLAEIQQSSNVTYRVYDWNRVPERTLHIDHSFAVLDFTATELAAVVPEPLPASGAELLAECARFRTERFTLAAGDELDGNLEGQSFEIWGAIAGSVALDCGDRTIELREVSWTLLPATLGPFRIRCDRNATLLRILTPSTTYSR
jgi:mannose-6-phosphate isomerase